MKEQFKKNDRILYRRGDTLRLGIIFKVGKHYVELVQFGFSTSSMLVFKHDIVARYTIKRQVQRQSL